MTPKQALSKARKLFGKNATVMVLNGGSSPEQRAEALAELRFLRAAPPLERPANWRALEEAAISKSLYYRCSIGRIELGMFNAIKGQGDTLQEAWDAAAAKYASKEAA